MGAPASCRALARIGRSAARARPHDVVEALAAATINPARSLGLVRELGSLEPGKLADLIVLDKNPLENIRNTDSVSMVMVNGRLYDAASLNEVASGTKKRGPVYWEVGIGIGMGIEESGIGDQGSGNSRDWGFRDSARSHSELRTHSALRTPNGLRTPDVALRTLFVIYWTSSVGYMISPCAVPQRIQDQSVLHTIGNTPLLRLAAIDQELDGVELYAKAEWLNPGGSVKDRPARRMVCGGAGPRRAQAPARGCWTRRRATPALPTR